MGTLIAHRPRWLVWHRLLEWILQYLHSICFNSLQDSLSSFCVFTSSTVENSPELFPGLIVLRGAIASMMHSTDREPSSLSLSFYFLSPRGADAMRWEAPCIMICALLCGRKLPITSPCLNIRLLLVWTLGRHKHVKENMLGRGIWITRDRLQVEQEKTYKITKQRKAPSFN